MPYNTATIQACSKLFENQELCSMLDDLMLHNSGISLNSLPVQEVPKVAVIWLKKVADAELLSDKLSGRRPSKVTRHTLDVINEIQMLMKD
jgi:hypothetical protein